MLRTMDPAPDDDVDEPRAAGDAPPVGWGVAAAVLFALVHGPLLAIDWVYRDCRTVEPCVPQADPAALAAAAVAALLVGLAAAWIVRRRNASRTRRPPVWAAIVALVIVAGMAAGLVLPWLLALAA